MAFSWTAKTAERTYTSATDSFQSIPQDLLRGFSLMGPDQLIEVNLLTGELAVNGHKVNMPVVDNLCMHQDRFRLHYFQRAFFDFDALGGKGGGRSTIEYAVCGWEGNKNRVYWRVDGQTGKVFLHLEDVV